MRLRTYIVQIFLDTCLICLGILGSLFGRFITEKQQDSQHIPPGPVAGGGKRVLK